MDINREGAQSAIDGPRDYFFGAVKLQALFLSDPPARVGGAIVTFEPGARTAWHTHPLGQRLFVTAGTGWAQCEGGAVVEIRRGDVIWFAPGERHWHGATPTTGMTHIAIAEAQGETLVDWLEHVSEDQYQLGI